ncbi:MAG: ABC transporter ATP-binding protein [Desulfuromonadales bacterium]|nr:ABC transporter ATP-binding protein [Desulfuromonadales bacterium]
MIKFVDISKEFKEGVTARKVKALQNLSLEIEQGQIFGFLGPNGAGKSTAIKILLNFIFSDSGQATIMDRDVGDKNVRSFVGYLPESPYFYDYLSAEELLWFGGRSSGMTRDAILQRSNLLLDKVQLQEARKRPLRTYSKGMVQRAGLALALIHNPAVVILDEPMSGLDPIGRKMVGDIILELKGEGKTVFFSSHILSDVERFCDQIGIIVGGQLRRTSRVADVLQQGDTLEDVFLREVYAAGLKEVR